MPTLSKHKREDTLLKTNPDEAMRRNYRHRHNALTGDISRMRISLQMILAMQTTTVEAKIIASKMLILHVDLAEAIKTRCDYPPKTNVCPDDQK